MLRCAMRTTITVDDDLLREARHHALREGRTLGQVVEDSLRVFLARRDSAPAALHLPTYGGSGLRPGVDLEDKDALAALLDEEDGAGVHP